jgi:hypothetical protein
MRYTLLCLLFLTLPVWCQDQAELIRTYRNAWSGHALQAELFERYFKVNAPGDWWSYLCTHRDGGGLAMVDLSYGILQLAPNLGWADAKKVDDDGGDALACLDSWKGKLSVTVNLPSGLNDEQKKQVMDNYNLISAVVGGRYQCMPRGGQFFLNISTSAKANEARGSVSKDGNRYEVILPVQAYATTMQLENIFKKGMK